MIVEIQKGESISQYFDRLMEIKTQEGRDVQGNVLGIPVSTEGCLTAIQLVARLQKDLDSNFRVYSKPQEGADIRSLDLVFDEDEIDWDNATDVSRWLSNECTQFLNNPRYANLLYKDGKKPSQVVCEMLEKHGYSNPEDDSIESEEIYANYEDLKAHGYLLSELLGGDISHIDSLVPNPEYLMTEEVAMENPYVGDEEEISSKTKEVEDESSEMDEEEDEYDDDEEYENGDQRSLFEREPDDIVMNEVTAKNLKIWKIQIS